MGVVVGQREVELLWMKVVMGDRRDTINESSCTLEKRKDAFAVMETKTTSEELL